MELTATVLSREVDFSIRWGDTVRVRDEYTPYFVLRVSVSDGSRSSFPALHTVLLYSLRSYPSNPDDSFDEAACIRGSRFHGLRAGSVLRVRGPVFRKSRSNRGELFTGYDHVVVQPDDLFSVSWLIEPGEVSGRELAGVSHLVVGWECAELVEPPP